MRIRTALQLALAATLVATGVSLAGCSRDEHPKGWSNQWYRKGQSPEETAAWRRKHPSRTHRDASEGAGDPSDPAAQAPN